MGVLVHPDREVHAAVQRAIDAGRLRVVAHHGSGTPWLLASPGERALTEVRTRYLDVVILSHLDAETATAVVLLAHARRALSDLDDLPGALKESAIVIAKDRDGATRIEGARAGTQRAVWVQDGMAVFASDDRQLLAEIFAPDEARPGRIDCGPVRTVPSGMWLHSVEGATPEVRAISCA